MKFLISAYTGLGNFILKTPMIIKIRELWPEAEIDIFTGNGFGTEFVLRGSDLINEIHILRKDSSLSEKLNFFLTMRKKQYSVVFLPMDAAPMFLILGSVLMGGIKYTHINFMGHTNLKQKFKNFLKLYALPDFRFVPWLQGRHEIDLNHDLLEAWYNRPMERMYETFITKNDSTEVLVRFAIEKGKYIVLQPSAANGSLTGKVWAPENFEALVQKIQRKYPDLQIVFVGDKGDLDTINKTALAGIKDVINTMGQTSIAELCSIIGNARIIVAHDSGVMHVADALKSTLIALYGPTDYTRTRPLGKNSQILFSKNDCFAVHYSHNITESDLAKQYAGYKCMNAISVDDVMGKMTELLALTAQGNSIE